MPTDDIDTVTDAPSTWPPPIYNGEPAFVNTSGMNTTVPPEIESVNWNWGAFLLPFFWAYANKNRGFCLAIAILGLLGFAAPSMLPNAFVMVYVIAGFIYLAISMILAINGHALAWQRRRFDGGVDEFFAVQRTWTVCGLAVAVLLVVAWPLFVTVRY